MQDEQGKIPDPLWSCMTNAWKFNFTPVPIAVQPTSKPARRISWILGHADLKAPATPDTVVQMLGITKFRGCFFAVAKSEIS